MTKLKKLHISLNLTNFVPCRKKAYCRRHLHHIHVRAAWYVNNVGKTLPKIALGHTNIISCLSNNEKSTSRRAIK